MSFYTVEEGSVSQHQVKSATYQSNYPNSPQFRSPMIESPNGTRDCTYIFHHCHQHTYHQIGPKGEMNLRALDESISGSKCCLNFLTKKTVKSTDLHLNSALSFFISLEEEYIKSQEATKRKWLEQNPTAPAVNVPAQAISPSTGGLNMAGTLDLRGKLS